MSWLPQNVHIDRNTTSPIIFSVSIYPQLAVVVMLLMAVLWSCGIGASAASVALWHCSVVAL